MTTSAAVRSERFFAACASNGEFSFGSISKKKGDVSVTPSDAKYGGIAVKPVRMTPLSDPLPAGVSAAELWSTHKVAWIWCNEDGSYWIDSLSISQDEATAWSSSPSRSRAIGMEVIPVRFQLD